MKIDELILSSNIYEYDIRKANISVLYDKGVISRDVYTRLYNADRMTRQVYIGKLQRDDENITKILQEGIKEARNKFMEMNNIDGDNIIRVSNDALYTTGVEILYTHISDHVDFIMKNKFTSYAKIDFYEFYYYYDQITESEKYKILGINNIEIHDDNFIQLFLAVFNICEKAGIKEGLDFLFNLIESYENLQFPVSYYREFSSNHSYRLKYGYELKNIGEEDKHLVSIEYNLNLLYRFKNLLLRQLI